MPDTRDVLAGRHYEAGRRLHNEGLFQEAIAEFLEAYRIKPHPNVVFNVAQAYERLLRYSDAVEWFERYLAEGGTDAPYRMVVENRLRVLRSLPARIHVECVPRATASLIDPDGLVEQAETPVEFRVRAGRYTLRVTREGHVAQERRIVADIGQPYFFQFTLEQQRELVTIRPTPAQSRIFLDQRLVGTGVYADRLPVGTHRLLVEYPRHEPFETEFTVRPGRKLEFDVALQPPPPQGRGEFIAGTGIYGGMLVPLTLHAAGILPEDWRIVLPTVIGGSGLGALVGFFATPRSIRAANSSLLLGSAAWGSMEGLSLGMLIDHRKTRLIAGLMAGGSVAGLGVGLALLRPFAPTPGQSAIINSGGAWGVGLGFGLGYALRGDRHDLDFTLVIGLNTGLLVSSILATQVEASRMRVFLIDVGTAAGAATGVLLAFAASPADPLRSGSGMANLARGGLVGGAIGLGTTIFLTRRYDKPRRSTVIRDSLLAVGGGEIRVGVPAPQIQPVVSPSGRADMAVTFRVASGTF